MIKAHKEKTEDRHERADRIAREIVGNERITREKKTARLCELRRKMERLPGA
jgi:hypothetical protein